MRRIVLATAAIAAIAAASSAAASGMTTVPIDQATRVTIAGSAANVFVGNASIADVAVINRNTLMITGKGYGITNIIVTDAAGRTIMDRMVQVSPGTDGRMTLYRASTPNNFACAPVCERTAMPGEPAAGVFEPFNSPVETYQKRQASGGGTAPK